MMKKIKESSGETSQGKITVYRILPDLSRKDQESIKEMDNKGLLTARIKGIRGMITCGWMMIPPIRMCRQDLRLN